jgi:hypothetical protein
MSEESQQKTSGWFKFFAGVNFFFYIFFLFMLSTCRFGNLEERLSQNVSCVAYAVFGIMAFGLGTVISMVGIDHAGKMGFGRVYFFLMLLMYFGGLALFFLT